jgi:hypothetical protein
LTKLEVLSTFASGTTITNANARYFRINLTKTVANNYFQVEKNVVTNYEPYLNTFTSNVKMDYSSLKNISKRLTGKTIAFFGDSITQDSNEVDHYPLWFEALTGARCINQGYGGTTMTKHTLTDFRPFSMTYLLQAKLSGDYTTQDTSIATWQAGTAEEQLRATNYTKQLNKFKALDFNSLYAITMLYGANDHGMTVGTITDLDSEGTTFCGAYNWVIKTLQENYPQLGIILLTPIFRVHDVGITDRTPLFVQATKDIANANNLPVYDCYQNLGFNKYNWTQYYSDDGLHPTEPEGQPRMGERISAWLNSVV